MSLAFVTVFTDDSSQVQITRLEDQTEFLVRLPAGTSIRGLTCFLVKLSATRAPETPVGFPGSFQEQHVVAPVEAVEQGGNFVWQGHADIKAGNKAGSKSGTLDFGLWTLD